MRAHMWYAVAPNQDREGRRHTHTDSEGGFKRKSGCHSHAEVFTHRRTEKDTGTRLSCAAASSRAAT